MSDLAGGSAAEAKQGVQPTSATSADDLLTLIRQPVHSILQEMQVQSDQVYGSNDRTGQLHNCQQRIDNLIYICGANKQSQLSHLGREAHALVGTSICAGHVVHWSAHSIVRDRRLWSFIHVAQKILRWALSHGCSNIKGIPLFQISS